MNDSQKLIIAKKILLGFNGLGQAEIVEGKAIFVKNNKIHEIGPTSELKQKCKNIPEIFVFFLKQEEHCTVRQFRKK